MTITATTELRTKFGEFVARHHVIAGVELVSLAKGDLTSGLPIVRFQSACLFGQSLHSIQCDCSDQLNSAMQEAQRDGGVLVFSPKGEGKGAGLSTKLQAMELERITGCGMDEAYFKLGLPRNDFREFDLEALALKELGVAKRIRFVSENQKKREAVRAAGFEIA